MFVTLLQLCRNNYLLKHLKTITDIPTQVQDTSRVYYDDNLLVVCDIFILEIRQCISYVRNFLTFNLGIGYTFV